MASILYPFCRREDEVQRAGTELPTSICKMVRGATPHANADALESADLQLFFLHTWWGWSTLPGASLHWFCRAKGGDRVVESLAEIHRPFTSQNCESPSTPEQEGLGKNRLGSTPTRRADQHPLVTLAEISAKLLDKKFINWKCFWHTLFSWM